MRSLLLRMVDTLTPEDTLDSADKAALGNTQSLTLATVVKHRLLSWFRFTPNLLATFLRMFPAPFKSALITVPSAERYKPRLIRLPDAFHSGGFSPYLGRESPSRKLDCEVYASSVSVNLMPCKSHSCFNRSFNFPKGS